MSWPDLENALSDACDDAFGQAFEFRPMTRPNVNARSAADTSRAVRTVTAIWSSPAVLLPDLGERDSPSGFVGRAKMTAAGPTLAVDLRQFAAEQGPRRGDHFAAVSSSKVYEVTDVQADGQGRMVMPVVEVPQ